MERPDPVGSWRDQIFATVSHELKTPLASIIGYTELLADLGEEHLSPEARRMVGIIARNADRELRLVDDLLSHSWLEDPLVRLAGSPVDLAAVAGEAVAGIRPAARESGVLVRLEAGDVPPVPGDAERLLQVVERLLSNAVKFTPAGGRVDVRLHEDGGTAVLEVADTGIGVAPESRDRVFERLYRAPEAVEAHLPGAGLGLSLVRAVVSAHRGRVELESEPGQGSLFRVVLPVEDPAALTRVAAATTR